MTVSSSDVRVVYMGSPTMALPPLQALLDMPGVNLVGVFAQPDKPAGRQRKLTPCPVAALAAERGVALLTPAKAGDESAMAALAQWRPDVVVVCAYGKLLPTRVLTAAPLGCYNLHFSRLPRWRGASPVQAAILAGDATTGVSLQRMVLELDAGPIVAESALEIIAPTDTTETLGGRLSHTAAGLLRGSLPEIISGRHTERPQDATGITHCRQIAKEEGALRFADLDAAELERRVRAFTPWPGTHVFVGGMRLGVVAMEVGGGDQVHSAITQARQLGLAEGAGDLPLGVLLPGGWVACREGMVRLTLVKPEGKGVMPFGALANGHPHLIGQRLTPEKS